MGHNDITPGTTAYFDAIEPMLLRAMDIGLQQSEDVRKIERSPSTVTTVLSDDITRAIVRLVPAARELAHAGGRSWVHFPDFAVLRVKCTDASWIGRNRPTTSASAFVNPSLGLPGIESSVPRFDLAYQFRHQDGTITAAAIVWRNADTVLWERRLAWNGSARTTTTTLELDLIPPAVVRPKRRRDEQAQR
jgi:hypothetical protein